MNIAKVGMGAAALGGIAAGAAMGGPAARKVEESLERSPGTDSFKGKLMVSTLTAGFWAIGGASLIAKGTTPAATIAGAALLGLGAGTLATAIPEFTN